MADTPRDVFKGPADMKKGRRSALFDAGLKKPD
jgi:hypothetical protein